MALPPRSASRVIKCAFCTFCLEGVCGSGLLLVFEKQNGGLAVTGASSELGTQAQAVQTGARSGSIAIKLLSDTGLQEQHLVASGPRVPPQHPTSPARRPSPSPTCW